MKLERLTKLNENTYKRMTPFYIILIDFNIKLYIRLLFCPVGWGCQIHRLLLCNKCPVYDNKQSDDEVLLMLELWGMQSIRSLPSLPGPLWPGVVVPDRVLSMGQIELNCVLILNWIAWNRTFWHLNRVFMLNWIALNVTVLYAKQNCLK